MAGFVTSSDPRYVATLLNYGRDPTQLDAEIQMDIYCGVLQRPRTMFYARSYGCAPMENAPSGIQFMLGARYAVASWIARRNRETGDGSGSTVDRRAITSQALITMVATGPAGNQQEGAVELQVIIIPMHSIKKPFPVQVPMGGK